MTTFDYFQAVGIVGSLLFVAIQCWLMRRAVEEQRNQLKVQSCLQIWQAHIQTSHLSIAAAETDEIARELNKMSPYWDLEIADARRAHLSDGVMDLYECIDLMGELGILDEVTVRVWKDSVPYEMQNPHLRKHWLRWHAERKDTGIYRQPFADRVDKTVRGNEIKGQEGHSEGHPL